MKKITRDFKYICLLAATITLSACSSDDDASSDMEAPKPALVTGNADFSKYIAVGASFSAGFTDNALFAAAQNNSFPNLLSQKFALAGGGSFTQPLMADNIGGLLFNGVLDPNGQYRPRLFFDGAGPSVLNATPTTEATNVLSGSFNNYGIPGLKSFHLGVAGYGFANPYFGRMASNPMATVLGDAAGQAPTFFSLSEIGGNDVLSYAISGGTGVDQTGNFDPSTYGLNDITDPNVFSGSFTAAVNALIGTNNAKGVVTNVPYIATLAHFTTVPYNPLDPSENADFAAQVPTLNNVFGALNPIFNAVDPSRAIVFSATEPSPVVLKDETLTDISSIITTQLLASPTFPAFIAQFGLPPAAAPLVAGLLGQTYGQSRQATPADLFVLPSSSIIGKVNQAYAGFLIGQGLSAAVAGQFSVEGVTLPLADKWVLIPSEQAAITAATDAYNASIQTIASDNGLALVDFKGILEQASTTGYPSGNYIYNTALVRGGLVSLDGVHLTARGYAIIANEMMKAIDATYGSNFEASGNFIDPGTLPTNYPPSLR
ncbi:MULTISPECIES: SGNH/GDSL hydrolase family protein [Bizionia]|uniref:G-D-S-L family lipolytic protein n=1 Tax=Bizionia algoritergicola TaxID=291187 RepID=A0A5D0R086_9FLAO|nr:MULTISPECIES: G-D-S-L family lipolytic protein [Bizionia]OBX23538.1 G-D-S-L family lipolytic protein [Bizionia sp. APA-3]TYB74930.1 G-D-S-L family lipolytic protein [Bizionia algoritergicola]